MEKVSRKEKARERRRGGYNLRGEQGVASKYRLHVGYTQGLPFGWAILEPCPRPSAFFSCLMPCGLWLMPYSIPDRRATAYRAGRILASPFAAGDGPPVTRSTVKFHAVKTVFSTPFIALFEDVRNGRWIDARRGCVSSVLAQR